MRRNAALTIGLLVGIVASAAGAWALVVRETKAPTFSVVAVTRGNIVSKITATGTLEPEAAVDIGAQVAGVIVAFGKDANGNPVSWGSAVEQGTVLARIDDSLYAAAVKTAVAQVAQGEANLLAARANVLQQKANLLLASQNWDRAQKLGPSDALAKSAYDQYEASYEVAKANLAAAQAAVQQAQATADLDKANLLTAQINLNYCTIRSPVKGVIVDRRVNIGQTVVSSLSAPSLFLIANDLAHIQAWVSVNEADVASITPGGPVTFTVDAIPGQVFQGRVGQVRLNATMTQNVVTYTVEVDVDNVASKLLPYLTVNAQFETGRHANVLLVPSVALQWTPSEGEVAPDSRRRAGEQISRSERSAPEGNHGILWKAEGAFVRPMPVTTGLSDGALVEVTGAGLSEGMPVVVGDRGRRAAQEPPSGEQNPFAPQIPRGPNQAPSAGRSGGQAAQPPTPSATLASGSRP